MTIAHPTRGQEATRTSPPIQWVVVQSGLWVGKAGGEFAGMIERRDSGFAALRGEGELRELGARRRPGSPRLAQSIPSTGAP
jgi:hypothetical protein